MFRALHAIAKHTPLTLIITPKGEQLSVIVMPKPKGTDNAALSQPISAIGTPEDLDAELPAALATYAAKVNEVRTALDLPLDALEKAKAKAEKKSAPKPAAAKPAKKPATKAATKARTAPAKKKPAPSAKGPALPGKDRAAAKHWAHKPTKEECLADYRTLHAQRGDKLTRRSFIKQAKTGRRYESLWKNWEAFVEEARETKDAADETIPAADETITPPGDTSTAAPTFVSTDDWPFPVVQTPEQVAADSATDKPRIKGPAAVTADAETTPATTTE